MKIVLRGQTNNYDAHRILLFTAHVPKWWQLFTPIRLVEYVGAGRTWRTMKVTNGAAQFFPVTNKKIIDELEAFHRGEKFYNNNKNFNQSNQMKNLLLIAFVALSFNAFAQKKPAIKKHEYVKFVKVDPADFNNLLMSLDEWKRLAVYDPTMPDGVKVTHIKNLDIYKSTLISKSKLDSVIVQVDTTSSKRK